jgi:hypothetical protein
LVRTINVLFVVTGAAAAAIRLAVSSSSTAGGVAVSDYVTYDFSLAGTGAEYEKTSLVVASGEYVWVQASVAGVSVRAHGFEGSA